jgi:hypothetical protein
MDGWTDAPELLDGGVVLYYGLMYYNLRYCPSMEIYLISRAVWNVEATHLYLVQTR